jgi:hypothetical protein
MFISKLMVLKINHIIQCTLNKGFYTDIYLLIDDAKHQIVLVVLENILFYVFHYQLLMVFILFNMKTYKIVL